MGRRVELRVVGGIRAVFPRRVFGIGSLAASLHRETAHSGLPVQRMPAAVPIGSIIRLAATLRGQEWQQTCRLPPSPEYVHRHERS